MYPVKRGMIYIFPAFKGYCKKIDKCYRTTNLLG